MHVRAKLMTSAATLLAAAALTATAYAQDSKSLAEPSKDWETFHGSYKGWNYSPLKQINTANVGKLQAAWSFSTGVLRGHEGAPLVIGINGVLLVVVAAYFLLVRSHGIREA